MLVALRSADDDRLDIYRRYVMNYFVLGALSALVLGKLFILACRPPKVDAEGNQLAKIKSFDLNVFSDRAILAAMYSIPLFIVLFVVVPMAAKAMWPELYSFSMLLRGFAALLSIGIALSYLLPPAVTGRKEA